MVGLSAQSLTRVTGDQWTFPVRYTDAAGAAIDLSAYELDCIISWPGSQVALTADQVDLVGGTFRLLLDPTDTAQVPAGRTAKLFVRFNTTDGPMTLAIVPLQIVTP